MKKLSKSLVLVLAIGMLLSTGSTFAASNEKSIIKGMRDQITLNKSLYPSEVTINQADYRPGKVGVNSVLDPETLANGTDGGKNNSMYAGILVSEMGLLDPVHMYYEGEGTSFYDGDEQPQNTTCRVTMSVFGVMPSLSFNNVSASGTSSASAVVSDSRNGSYTANVYFDHAYATFWNMIDVKFDTNTQCRFSEGTYSTNTNVTFWIS